MIWFLLLLPMICGLAAFVMRPDGPRRAMLVLVGLAHAGAVAVLWTHPDELPQAAGGYLKVDSLGLLFLSIVSLLYMAACVYAVGYLRREKQAAALEPARPDFESDQTFVNVREATFTGCLLLFLGTMTLVTLSHNFGLLWVGLEATTLASAPLIHFHRHHRSLEATWKYLLICSVGIALALLGNFFLAASAGAAGAARGSSSLSFDQFSAMAQQHVLNPTLLKAAFILLLVGYGTKMGLAPMHTWLPDAHSEAPSVVSAMLSGALLNCALLGVLRVHAVCGLAGIAAFSSQLLVAFGLVSMMLAAVFILGQADFKRMLAYSSVEHMGILAVGVGISASGAAGAMFHAVNHSAAKAAMFLLAGNILAFYQTKTAKSVSGMGKLMPATALLWLAGLLAITGSPPFGTFMSELMILRSALDAGRIAVAVVYLAALCVAFVGMITIALRMTQSGAGAATPAPVTPTRESRLSIIPPAALMCVVLVLGFYKPPQLDSVMSRSSQLIAPASRQVSPATQPHDASPSAAVAAAGQTEAGHE